MVRDPSYVPCVTTRFVQTRTGVHESQITISVHNLILHVVLTYWSLYNSRSFLSLSPRPSEILSLAGPGLQVLPEGPLHW